MNKIPKSKKIKKKFMGAETKTVQDRLRATRYSKNSGYEVIAQKSRDLASIKGGPKLTYSWLSKFGRNEIKSPSYDRMERLIAILDALENTELLSSEQANSFIEGGSR